MNTKQEALLRECKKHQEDIATTLSVITSKIDRIAHLFKEIGTATSSINNDIEQLGADLALIEQEKVTHE